ncbi:MAG: PAS domain S-box protein [Euryarchaeota archaeon]|nr:PAS domain S-box protein [Euryarchaeota archaeon]
MLSKNKGAGRARSADAALPASAPVPASTVFYTAPPGDIVGRRACHGGLELLGYSCSPAREDAGFWGEKIHPDDRRRVMREMAVLVGKGSVSCEYRLQCADGSYKWVLDGAVLLRDQAGGPTEIVGAVHDISNRKALDEGIWEHEEFLDTMLESTPGGVFLLDGRSRIVYLTKRCQDFLGLSDRHWVRGNARFRVHPSDASAVSARMRRALGGKPCGCTARVKAADGSYKRAGLEFSPVSWRGRSFLLGIVGGCGGDGRKRP